MEKKIIDKIDETYEILNKRIEDINLKFKILFDELLTKDVIHMIIAIRDFNKGNYVYRFAGNKTIIIGLQYRVCEKITCFYTLGYDDNRSFKMNLLNPIAYNDNYIYHLESRAKELSVMEDYYKLIINNLKNIIDDITETYRNISETQSDKLDAILSQFDADYTPTKHIKVTVEWV